jgi:hypothetical protein
MLEIPPDWGLSIENNPQAKKYIEILTSYSKRLEKDLIQETQDDKKNKIVQAYYRKFLTIILTKEAKLVGVSKSPTRDYILDYPWIVCGMSRYVCSKIWDKVDP